MIVVHRGGTLKSLFLIRRAGSADYDMLGHIMFRAIRQGASPYTEAQRVAWQARPNAGADWAARLATQTVMLGEARSGIVGFMSCDPDGYVGLAFILPGARGQGLFDQLLGSIEANARDRGITRLHTHASLLAQPAFARSGFSVDHHESVLRFGQTLTRAAMSKTL